MVDRRPSKLSAGVISRNLKIKSSAFINKDTIKNMTNGAYPHLISMTQCNTILMETATCIYNVTLKPFDCRRLAFVKRRQAIYISQISNMIVVMFEGRVSKVYW